MRNSRKAALTLAAAAGVLLPVAAASSAQAIAYPDSVLHDTCRVTVLRPEFNGKFNSGGRKIVDYPYRVSCSPSAAGLTVEVRLERWESDLATRPGDPNVGEDLTGTATRHVSIAAAGETKNRTHSAVLPDTDDTDDDEEMYLGARFRVKNGGVTGTWSATMLSDARAIQH